MVLLNKEYKWGLGAAIVVFFVMVVLYSRRQVFLSAATLKPPAGYKVTISPPRSASATWLTYNGSTLLVPVKICNKWVNDFVLDTGSGRLVVLDMPPCGRVGARGVELSYGSMAVSAAKAADPVDIEIGTLGTNIKLPTAYFANSCDRGHCANILGLMPPESGGTFPHHSFSIIFDGVGGGWFGLYPDPPDNAIALPYTVLKGFYTLESVLIVNPKTQKRTSLHAVVDSGTTLVEFPPNVDVNAPLQVYSSDGKTLLASLQPSDMATSQAVGDAFPSDTFVFGLPFFRRRHVSFNGDQKRIYIYN